MYSERNPIWFILGIAIVVLSVLALGSCSFTKVGQGHVGVKVNNMGSNAGVDLTPLGVGWYFTPPGTTIYEYPIFTNNHTWEGDNRFTFQDKNGMSVAADVSVAYRANASKAPILFQKYRVEIEGILNGPVRNTIRNAIVSQASTMSVDQIYGPQKARLIENARIQASKYLEPYGLHIEQLFWAGNILLPESIQNQINARVANEQAAIAEQAKVATAKAKADAAIAAATGKAEAMKLEQQAIAASPQILELRAIEKWKGDVPQYVGTGSAIPFVKSIN